MRGGTGPAGLIIVKYEVSAAAFLLVFAFMGGSTGCSEQGLEPDATAKSAAASACDYRFESSAARLGSARAARLLYACEGDACTGDEHFARGTTHTISIELDAPPETVLTVTSTNPEAARVNDVVGASTIPASSV